jgi:hypothetical protein
MPWTPSPLDSAAAKAYNIGVKSSEVVFVFVGHNQITSQGKRLVPSLPPVGLTTRGVGRSQAFYRWRPAWT